MKDPLKLGLTILIFLILGAVAIKVTGWLLGILVPVAVVAAIVLIIVGVAGKKSIGGGRRWLP